MKSVYYGESAQDLCLGTCRGLGFDIGREGRGGGGEGEAGCRFIKVLTLWFLSTKQTQHTWNGSTESVGRTSPTRRAQKEESQYFILKNLQEKKKCSLQFVFFLSFSFLCLLLFGYFIYLFLLFLCRAPPVFFVAASVQHGLTDRESSIFFI